MTMKQIYLVMAIVGGVVPYIFFLDFFANEGIAISGFLAALFVNGAAGGFTADLLITSTVFWLFLFSSGVSKPWLYIAVNLTIGLSCAVPLYLYMAEKGKEQPAVT